MRKKISIIASIVLLTGLLSGLPRIVSSQDSLRISLDDIIQKALAENLSIKGSRASIDVAKALHRQSLSAFLPGIDVEYSAIYTNNPIGVFGYKLRQQSITMADFSPDVLNKPDALENFGAVFSARQSVFDASSVFERKAAKNMLVSSELALEETKNLVRFKISELYFRLIFRNESIRSIKEHQAAAEATAAKLHSMFNEGLVSKPDALLGEIRITQLRSELKQAQNELLSINRELMYLMGEDGNYVIIPTGVHDVSVEKPPVYDTEVGNSFHIQALKQQVHAFENKLKAGESRFLPTVQLFGNFEVNDNSFLGTAADNYTIGVSVRWNIFSGNSRVEARNKEKAVFRTAQIKTEQAIEERKLEAENALDKISENLLQLELAELKWRQADEEYEIRQGRFSEGLETVSDVLEALAQKHQAEVFLAQTIYHLNTTYSYLNYLIN